MNNGLAHIKQPANAMAIKETTEKIVQLNQDIDEANDEMVYLDASLDKCSSAAKTYNSNKSIVKEKMVELCRIL